MQVLRHLARASTRFPAPVVALGTFDGIHIGHQRILQRAVDLARQGGGTPIAVTLYQHPVAATPFALSIESLRQRLSRIAALGLDPILIQRVSVMSAVGALQALLRQDLGAQSVVFGERVGLGGAAALTAMGRQCGIRTEVVAPVVLKGKEVSRAALRQAILTGDLIAARAMLGRDPEVSGHVRRGFQRGRTIGFPTANLRVGGVALPPNGVYVVRVRIDESVYGGVANLGVNPTFGGSQRTLEPHIFDFDGDLYGQRIDVQFVEALRAERKFPSIDELVKQIRSDAEAARAVLERA